MLKPKLKSARLAALAVVTGGIVALWWHTISAPQIMSGTSRALTKPAVMASVLTPAVPTSLAGLTPAEGTNLSAGDEQSAILAVLALPNTAERAPGLARELERWLLR